MTMQRFRVGPASRRQLLQKILTLGTSLVVARAVPAIAAPASTLKTTARQQIKTEEKPLMPEIMHLIKIRASQDKVYQAVSTAEGIRDWWTRDAAFDAKVGGTGELGVY